MLETGGLLVALILLMLLALKGVNIIFASMLCSLIVMITNGISPIEGFSNYYVSGPVGAFTFAGKFFVLFVTGAMFGRVMASSGSATSFALSLSRKFGSDKTLLIITLVTALLTYGGVTIFIVIFALYPLSLRLLREGNIPKRLFLAAFLLGGGTFTLSALPGTPSIHNVIPASALGTDLFAGAWIGIVASLVMLFLGLWYLEWQRKRAIIQGETFVAAVGDDAYQSNIEDHQLHGPFLAVLPLLVVLGLIIIPRLISLTVGSENEVGEYPLSGLIQIAVSQPILWPSLALTLGSIITILLSQELRAKPMVALGSGAQDAIGPLINTAAVIGFGSVVAKTNGFHAFSSTMLTLDIPPLLSTIISANITSGIVGSSSGGLQIFMETLAPAYLEMGINKEVLHRLATIAAGGFDSLPHSGGVIAFLVICSATHKEAYKDIAIVSIAIPLIALVFVTPLAMFLY